MNTELWIDGDIYAYRACAAIEQEVNWGDDIWSLSSDLAEAKQIIYQYVFKWLESYPKASLIWTFSDSKNFRKEVYPAYKSNRKGKRKPIGYAALVKWICDTWDSKVLPWCEADDVLGIFGSEPVEGVRRLIISEDKDMDTLPISFPIILDCGLSKEYTTSEHEADLAWLTQTLTGDSTDGYPGCPKVGAKTAPKLLSEGEHLGDYWDIVVAAFEKQGLTEADALVQARCARILRWGEYDFEKSEVILWSPEGELV